MGRKESHQTKQKKTNITTAFKRVWKLLKKKKRYSGKPYTATSDWQKFQMKLYKPCDEMYHRWNVSSVQAEWTQTNHFQQVKSFILNHGSHVKWLSNVSLSIAIADAFFRRKKTSICIRLYKTEDCCLSVRPSVCLSVRLVSEYNKYQQFNLLFW